MKPYEQLTDEEAEAEVQRIAERLGLDPEAVRAWMDQKRAGVDGDVQELDLTSRE